MTSREPNHVIGRYRPFVMVPVEVLDEIVDPMAITVYLRLRQHADQHGDGAHPSRQRLAKMVGHSTPRAVDKAIARLVELGLVDVFARYRTGDGRIVVEPEDGAAQTSNGFIIYDVPGAGAGAGTVPAPVEAGGQGVVAGQEGVHERTPPQCTSVHPPQCTSVHPPSARTATLTRSHELDPDDLDPPSPPAAEESAGPVGVAPDNGEGEKSNMDGPRAGAGAPRGGYPQAVAIVTRWAESRAGALTQSWRGKFVGHVSAALESGHDPGVVERALAAWDDGTSLSPNRLPYLIEQEAERVRAERSSARSSRAEAEATARMLDERRARVRGAPGTVDTEEFMRRALSPEAWARRQARMKEGGDGGEPPRR